MNKHLGILLLSVAALLVIGAVVIDSVTMRQAVPHLLHSHLLLIGLGLLGAAGLSFMNYAWWRRWHVPQILIVVALVLLGLVLVPGVGTCRNGAYRWLWKFQPSELAKLAGLIGLADYCAAHLAEMDLRRVGFTRPALLAGLWIGLIFAEPDWGTAALSAVIAAALLYLAGAHWGYLVASGIVGVELLIHALLLKPDKLTRILVFLDPQRFADAEGRQVWHSLVAIGSGGWVGALLGGDGHKLAFVSQQRSDFILSRVAEDFGFVGAALVVLLFISIVICGVRIGWRIADPFGRFLVLGITLLIGTQAFINIGVATSSLPNKGIPLPFVSHGGSSMVTLLLGVGLLVSVGRHASILPVVRLPKKARPEPEPSSAASGEGPAPASQPGLLAAVREALRRIPRPRRNPFATLDRRHAYQKLPRGVGVGSYN